MSKPLQPSSISSVDPFADLMCPRPSSCAPSSAASASSSSKSNSKSIQPKSVSIEPPKPDPFSELFQSAIGASTFSPFSSPTPSSTTSIPTPAAVTSVALPFSVINGTPEPNLVPPSNPAIKSLTEKKIHSDQSKRENELDLVFCLDCTSSMSPYIQKARENITQIVTKIVAAEKVDVQFGLIAYRDHPPQDSTFVTKIFPLTNSKNTMLSYLNMVDAVGGGDGPEAVTSGLYQVLNVPFRKHSTRICVLVGDAPCHGLGEAGDGFPNGDPDGHDPIKIAKQMFERGITIYSVACEPSLSNYKFAVDFFEALAKITEGKFLPLTSATLLAEAIIGCVLEEVNKAKLMADLEEQIKLQKAQSGKPLTQQELAVHIAKSWEVLGVKPQQVQVDDIYLGRSAKNTDMFCFSDSLAAVAPKLQPSAHKINPMYATSFGASPSGVSSTGSDLLYFSMPSAPAPAPAPAPALAPAPAPTSSSYDLFDNFAAPSSKPTSFPLHPMPQIQQVYNYAAPPSASYVEGMLRKYEVQSKTNLF